MSQKTKITIIGSGPAGYSAAIYSARAQLRPILFAGQEIGGQLMYTTEVENFSGFSDGIMGPKLMNNFKVQAEKFGAEIKFETVYAVDFSSRPFKLWTHLNDASQDPLAMSEQEYIDFKKKIKSNPADLESDVVIVCTGATGIMLGLENEKRLLGRGVSVCAVCDAAFFKDKKVFVIGGGDSAMEDALALANFTDKVTIIHRRDEFRASLIMQQRVLNHRHIKVLWNSEVVAINGKEQLDTIVVSTKGKEQEFEANGLFLAIGHRPVTKIFKNELELTDSSYIVTSQSPSQAGVNLAKKRLNEKDLVSFPTMTSVNGVFAAGDVVDSRYKQAITAAGMGVAAALDAEAWISSLK
ncbi:MAG: Thioredoxin reductase [Microgenomates bacterium 39_7]|nr:MAG: Thioredoxin reductase [Microgenomates bacterium 39_7]